MFLVVVLHGKERYGFKKYFYIFYHHLVCESFFWSVEYSTGISIWPLLLWQIDWTSRISRSAYYYSGLFWHGICVMDFYPTWYLINTIKTGRKKNICYTIGCNFYYGDLGCMHGSYCFNCRIINGYGKMAGRILVYQCRIILAGFLLFISSSNFLPFILQNMIYKIPIK